MIQKLIRRIRETGVPVVVGLDPDMKFIPRQLMQDAAHALAGDACDPYAAEDELRVAAEAVWRFNREIIDGIADLVPAVKPQIAMYEQFGLPGMETFWRTVRYCQEKGLIVIGDVKRGDIGSTSAAYARAHLGRTVINGRGVRVFDEDFATVNPYLGSDGVKPFVDVCREYDKGIFVLVKTSNPSSGEFQDVKTADGRTVYELVAEKVREWGAEVMEDGYSNVGAVVGATYPEQGKILRRLMPNTFILVPGYGAQGGKAADLLPFFNEDGMGAIINSSRGIIAAYTNERYSKYGPERFAEAARQATKDMIDDLHGVGIGGGLS
ncbi:orotidine-5'-phosphate decarboxylase [Lachnoclostridium sp. Marseille-P6806]|uniref:orotidine-5'-phosphate decarboxylase n=1 Tax=Lachnoclostridium sp. Marseille-P6806 TaxID=2364793 RepID=UPI001030A41B|nr:orotidine-5'-phosphate decarboxylase [Lachnoclostridium sp. Marseille-P6806]